MVELVEPRIIRGSRGKTFLLLLACPLVFLAGIGTVRSPAGVHAVGWIGIFFSGLSVPFLIRSLIRPHTLTLDDSGFMIGAGPKKVAWQDIKGFHVWRPRNRSKLIGYNFEPGARKETSLMRINRGLGAEGCLPGGWQFSTDKMVEILNAYRVQALARQAEHARLNGLGLVGTRS